MRKIVAWYADIMRLLQKHFLFRMYFTIIIFMNKLILSCLANKKVDEYAKINSQAFYHTLCIFIVDGSNYFNRSMLLY